ncbi:transglycosylase SLT domain-containing protein [Amycolatopsis sp. GM8]|uniref:transglycosylase SLT domain-containing protein n=1 Tax=Amycolatopsis sp. GM8 TaxID=2896530 RepID=UPI001F1C9FEE|nr:transglycosylase SLT domain-containing protein [Amycolatopsis sp. GM8]
MSRLTAEQIAQHAYRAGFRGQALTTAVAVALAESSGNAGAHNGTPPDNSYGLWQVNMIGDLGPTRRKEFDLDSNKELFDPDHNAKAAYAISGHGKSFEPWSTYTNGAYKKHLAAARKAAEDVTKHHGKSPVKHEHKPAHHKGNGFKADPEQFRGYAKKADDVAAKLREIGTRTVRKVTGIAKDSFGQVGAETGFADALGDFSRSLEAQVKTTATGARNLGELTTKAGHSYQAQDDTAMHEIAGADISSVLG